MASPRVLIISYAADYTAKAIKWALESVNIEVRFFDTSGFEKAINKSSFRYENDQTTFKLAGEASDPTHVWHRRHARRRINPNVHKADQDFVQRESSQFDLYLLKLLERQNTATWTDQPALVYAAENKLSQLQVAADLGLSIPSTLISQDADDIKDFLSSVKRAIIKPFNGYIWEINGAPRFEATTRRIQLRDLASRESVEVCPAIYQEEIAKKSDIRAVAIGSDLYAVRYTQKIADNVGNVEVDSRIFLRDSRLVGASEYIFPDSVRAKIFNMLDSFGISFASMDFLEADNGTLYFIDLNPGGQFLFNEHYFPEHKLLRAMAAHIVRTPADDLFGNLNIDSKSFESSKAFAEYQSVNDANGGVPLKQSSMYSVEA